LSSWVAGEQGRVGFKFIKQLKGRVSGRGEGHGYRRWFGKGFRLEGNERRRGFSE
jgi:hypothetical protein